MTFTIFIAPCPFPDPPPPDPLPGPAPRTRPPLDPSSSGPPLRRTAQHFALFSPSPTTIFVLSSLSWVSSSACARQEVAVLVVRRRFWSEGDWMFPIWLVTIDSGPKATVKEVAAAVRSRCKAGSTDEVPTNQPRWPTMEEAFPGWWFSHSNKQGAQSRSSVESSGSRGAGRAGLEVSLRGRKRRSPLWNTRSPDSVETRVAKLEKVLESSRAPQEQRSMNQERTRQGTNCGTREASGGADFGVQGFCSRETVAQVEAKRVAKIASLEQNRARFVRLEAEQQASLAVPPRQQPFSSWERKFPSPNRVGRHTHSATSRPTCQEATIARRFCPQHSRGGGVVVEVQATGDDVIGQHSGRLEIGNSNCGGEQPSCGRGLNPFRR